MLDSLILSINVVLPLFGLMGVGYFLKVFKLVSEDALRSMNGLVFKVLLPFALFQNLISTNFASVFNLKLIIFSIIAILLTVVLSMFIMPLFDKDPLRIGVLVQGAFRSNFILFGLPIAMSLYSDIGVTTIVIAIMVPLFNVLAVIVLEYYHGGNFHLKNTIIKTFENPIIMGALSGLVVLILRIELPTFALKVVNSISASATPIALMILGGLFEFRAVGKNIKALSVVVFAKLIIVPVIFVGLALLLGFRKIELVTLLMLFGSPIAVSSYSMADAMGLDGELASQAILISTVLSIVTIFSAVFLFNYFSLL